jgi:antitoxin component YwqK of YwqJK toxin-antitoxin module
MISGMKELILISALLLLASNVYANDLPTDGAFQIPHANGKLYLKGELKNDKKEGTWEFYYDNGQLQAVEKYSGGKPVGVWKYYEENGKLIKRVDSLMDNSIVTPALVDHYYCDESNSC